MSQLVEAASGVLPRLFHTLRKPTAPQQHFCLEVPRSSEPHTVVKSPETLAGWIVPVGGQRVESIDIAIDDAVVARAALRLRRPDVHAAHPHAPASLFSGFVTEVPLDEYVGRTVNMSLAMRLGGERSILAERSWHVEESIGLVKRRARNFDLPSLLQCPLCRSQKLHFGETSIQCQSCQASFDLRRGAPIFAAAGEPAATRFLEQGITHPYCDEIREIIGECRNGLVLDFGAGNHASERYSPNVLFHEAVQYSQSDVICTLPQLPYRDNTFDAVISQAVFEHVTRPWETAAELYRILKPGGRIHIDTAFLQPFHGDPCHYFNMTLSGLRVIFHQFEELAAGVKPYQGVTDGLNMQLETLCLHLPQGRWLKRVNEFLAALKTEKLDDQLDDYAREVLGAGVYFDGRKPQRG
jgi:SAM-dependent methyltransferase